MQDTELFMELAGIAGVFVGFGALIAVRTGEVSAMRITPRDLALLIDRLQVLFGRPAMIREGRGFAATAISEALPIEVLRGIIEATRGLAGTPPPEASPLPRLLRRHEDGLPNPAARPPRSGVARSPK